MLFNMQNTVDKSINSQGIFLKDQMTSHEVEGVVESLELHTVDHLIPVSGSMSFIYAL